MPEAGLDTLNCVYFALFFVGLGYAIFVAVTGGLADLDMPDVDIDIPQIDLPGDVDIPGADIQIGAGGGPAGIDAPDVTVSPLSPITVATFVTTFGGVGVLATQVFDVDPRLSLLWAVGSALVTAGLMYLFSSQFLVRSQASSELHQGELIGIEAEVQKVSINNKDTYHRVRSGPYHSQAELNRVRKQASDNNISTLVIKLKG